jgi:hypothetical protein
MVTTTGEIVRITEEDTVTKIFVDADAQADKNGKTYYRARHEGRGFTVTEDFYNEWEAGNIYEANLKESSYPVEDAQNPGQFIMRPSFQLTTWATYDQITKIEQSRSKLELGRKRHAVEVKKIEIEGELFEQEALAKFKLDDAKVAALQGD